MAWFIRRTAAVLVLGVVLAGCNGLNSSKEPGSLGGVTVGKPPPETAGTDLDGKSLDLGEFRGKVEGWEVWNEEDAPAWWAGSPPIDGVRRDTAAYTALLRATFRAVRSADRTTPVILGGLTGNDFRFLAGVYRNGGRGSFDAVGVHTDTGCNLAPPSGYLRDVDGRINQFSFLSYREVRRVMIRNRDRRKPIWMTELGWSTSGSLCDSGRFAGQKAGGVSEADQAAYTAQAFHCLRLTKYVTHALVFRLRDGVDRHKGEQKYDTPTQERDRADRNVATCHGSDGIKQ